MSRASCVGAQHASPRPLSQRGEPLLRDSFCFLTKPLQVTALLMVSLGADLNAQDRCGGVSIEVSASHTMFELTIGGTVRNESESSVTVSTAAPPTVDTECGRILDLNAGISCEGPKMHILEIGPGESCDFENYYFARGFCDTSCSNDPWCYEGRPPPGDYAGIFTLELRSDGAPPPCEAIDVPIEFSIQPLELCPEPIDPPPVAAIASPTSPARIELTGGTAELRFDATGSHQGGEEPFGPDTFQVRWSANGPAPVEFESVFGIETTATFTAPGEYTVTASIDDGFEGCSEELFYGFGRPATATAKVEVTGDVEFLRGDANTDGELNITDPVATLGVLFLAWKPLSCDDAADVDDDGELNITDAIAALSYLFLAAELPSPSFGTCGPDATKDGLADCNAAHRVRVSAE